MTLIWTLRERRSWSILQHPIDVQVDVLVVETDQVFNLRALWNWRRITELCGKVGDGVNQAADLISATASIPSLNFIPLPTFGNWF